MSSLASFDALLRARRSSRLASPGPLPQHKACNLATVDICPSAFQPIEPPLGSEWRDPWHCRLQVCTSEAEGGV